VAPQEVLQAVQSLADQDFKEIVLTGIHLGAYGLDLLPPTDLLTLLREIEATDAFGRLRVGSVEPTEFSPEFVEFVAGSKTVCPHLHIPLQAGSDGVLSRMNRGYDTALFRDLVLSFVKAVPDICIGADVIAGFPTETDAEFDETCAFISSLPLAYLHVFPFSARPGTPAATMQPQIAPPVARERAARLRKISEEKMERYVAGFVGKELQVLVQKDQRGKRGLSCNYLTVSIAEGDAPYNTEVRVLVTGARGGELVGRVIPS
jgi:threonylcarbamoyladenosine tRNA methylthiotransferase MtaB